MDSAAAPDQQKADQGRRQVTTTSETKQNRKKQKRGMKPRSKRNRKRARSQLHGTQNNDTTSSSSSSSYSFPYETSIRRLELDGQPVYGNKNGNGHASCLWLRTVQPYPYCFATFAKARWIGRTVLDVYANEFGSFPRNYYETAIRQGRILVSDQTVDLQYIIKGGDVLSHTVHRHEPGVLVSSSSSSQPSPVTVLEDSDEVLVVDKPATLPIHPCGGYHVQSLMSLLEEKQQQQQQQQQQRQQQSACRPPDDNGNDKEGTTKNSASNDAKNINTKLYTIHRLDRLTSGLVILGKTSAVAQDWGKCIMQRNCQKVYLARVAGKFPLNVVTMTDHTLDAENKKKKDDGDDGLKRLRSCSTVTTTETTTPPLHGEWPDDDEADGNDSAAAKARKRNAYTYWITTGDHNVLSINAENSPAAGAATNADLQRVFESQHSVDDWLESLDEAKIEKSSKQQGMLWFHLACPTRIAKHKDGVCEAGPFANLDDSSYLKTVKPAHTSFGVVAYDDKTDSTVVVCRPYTGRTHQIRLHLQHVGHCIANDPNYGGDMWYGNPEGRKACQVAQERLNVIKTAESSSSSDKETITVATTAGATTSTAIDVPATEKEIEGSVCSVTQEKEESIHDFVRRTCVWCARSKLVGGADRAVLEFLIRSPGIWLHALQYSFAIVRGADSEEAKERETNTKKYRAPLPDWHNFS